MSISSPDKKKVTTDSDVSLRMTSPTMISTAPSFPTIITPRTAIAADFIRTVFRDCQWRKDFTDMINILLVCREWLQIGTSLLWRKITIKSNVGVVSLLEGLCSPEREGIYRRAMKTLDLRVDEDLAKAVYDFVETGSCLTLDLASYQTKIDGIAFLESIGPSISQHVSTLKIRAPVYQNLSKFMNLSSLSFDYPRYVEAPELASLVSVAPQLSHLKLKDWNVADSNFIAILQAAVNLNDLYLKFDMVMSSRLAPNDERYHTLAGMMKDPTRVFFPKLKSLYFSSGMVHRTFILAFVERVPKNITKLGMSISLNVGAAILEHFSLKPNDCLRELKFWGRKEAWPLGPPRFTALESIYLYDAASESVLMQIATDCHDTLVRFTLDCGVEYTSDGRKEEEVLRDFFSKCGKLEELVFEQIFDASHLVDGLVHPNVREIQIYHDHYYRFERGLPRGKLSQSEIDKVWRQCPNLHILRVDGRKFTREEGIVQY